MDGMTTFTSDKEPLQDILRLISTGKIQLPEFQRGFVWNDIHIRSLLASLSLSYPIGAVMMLETGNPDVRFKPRPIEGVELNNEIEPERFILDGQQRLTSLYQTLYSGKVVKTQNDRKQGIKRWYYFNMVKSLDAKSDREEAIISLPEDKIIRNFRNEIQADYSTVEAEYKNMIFPVLQLFNPADWRREFNDYWQHDKGKSKLFDEFEKWIIERFKQYHIPVIKLFKNTPKVAVCQVFEKVNTGGVSLTVFELVTASFAADGYNLREDWEGKRDDRGKKICEGRQDKIQNQPQHKTLRAVGANELLQTTSLLTTYHRKEKDPEASVSCKRDDILKITLCEYKKWVEPATQGLIEAGKMLFQQNLFTNRDLPYTTQIVPLSTILTLLCEKADIVTVRDKIAQWYWCGVFGELYGGAIETRFAKDVVDILEWIGGGKEPKTVEDCNFAPTRLYTLRTRNSAAYKGLYAILMRDGGLDFRTGKRIEVQSYFEESVDIHHIFPRKWCTNKGIEPRFYDSIINKTPLSYKTNRIVGGNAPSVYLRKIREETGMTEQNQDDILLSHVINIEALKKDDFEAFFETRREALLNRIEKATGKLINREIHHEEPDVESMDENEFTEEAVNT